VTVKLMRAAIEAAISGMSPSLSTAWQNVAFTPANGTAYQRVEWMFARPTNNEFGANYRQDAICQVTLCYPAGLGPAAIETRAELLKTTFKRGLSFTSGGVTVVSSDTPEMMPAYIDGDRFCIPVRIRVYAHLVAS
jgi:hypothetical protein